MNGINKNENVRGHDTQILQAETQTEQALRASESSYHRLFKTAKDCVLILDEEQQCEHVFK